MLSIVGIVLLAVLCTVLYVALVVDGIADNNKQQRLCCGLLSVLFAAAMAAIAAWLVDLSLLPVSNLTGVTV